MRITKNGQLRLLLSYLIYTVSVTVVHAETTLAPIKQVKLSEAPPPWEARPDVQMPNYAQEAVINTEPLPQAQAEIVPESDTALSAPSMDIAPVATVAVPAIDAPLTLEDDKKQSTFGRLFSRKKKNDDYANSQTEEKKGLLGKLFSRKKQKAEEEVKIVAEKEGGIENWYKNRKSNTLANGSAEDLRVQATKGDSNAQYQLGLMYRSGAGIEQNKYQAIHWLTRAADADNTQAQYALAMIYRENADSPQDEKKAVSWYQRAANSGHADAQYSLGLLYANGDGIKQNTILANKWFKQSAEQGNMAAKVALIASGKSSSPATTQLAAIEPTSVTPKILPKVATPASASASPKVIELTAPPETTFVNNDVKPKNAAIVTAQEEPQEQIRVASITAPPRVRQPVQNDAAAPATVEEVSKPQAKASVSPSTVDTPSHQSRQLDDKSDIDVAGIQQGARAGKAKSQLLLGSLYEEGKGGMQQDYIKAAEWYRKSADQGYSQAQYNLGLLYEDGKGMEQDYYEASQWYKRAANNGFSEAQNNLGVLYIMGKGVIKNINNAELMFRRSADQGNENGKRNLKMLLKEK